MTATTLIVGANGKTGWRVNRKLSEAGYPVRAVSRSTTPAFDWNHPQGWGDVMAGCEQAYVTFQPDLAIPAAEEAIRRFIAQARQSGVKHLVLLSGRGEEGAQQAEQQLINSGLSWNVVRASWFAQNFSEGFLVDGILRGQLALPAADVPEPFVDVDDIADVAVACLTRPSLHNRVFEVTGPQLLTFAECVQTIASTLRRPLDFTAISAEHFLQSLADQGMPEDVLWLMNELFTRVMDGRNSRVAHGVEQALGRPATSFSDYVRKTAQAGHWSVA